MTERLWNPSQVLPNGMRVQVPSERLVPRGYPDQPDDGTWENEGGYVARRKPTAFVLEPLSEPLRCWGPERLLVVDAETWAELQLKMEAPCPVCRGTAPIGRGKCAGCDRCRPEALCPQP